MPAPGPWRSSEPRRGRPMSIGWLLSRFAGAGLLVLSGVAALIAVLARQEGTDQAIQSARQVTYLLGHSVIEPQLTTGVLAGEPLSLTRFTDTIRSTVIRGSLVRVKIWDANGKILYSDESRLVGRTFGLGEEEQAALRDNSTDSGISDLAQPENMYEVSSGKLLEVYTTILGPHQQPLLFESYFRYDAVAQAGQAVWHRFAPAALGGLVTLELVQIPFAWSLARRIQRQHADGARLLQRAVDASDAERRRIAADLHDGVVQQLTGVSYTLDAARLAGGNPGPTTQLLGDAAAQLRHTVGDLRTLLVDIYPPDLVQEGLPASLTELAGGVERGGRRVELDVADGEGLPPPAASVLFRAAQETLRNVTTHSNATRVDLTVRRTDSGVQLTTNDDGQGFDTSLLQERRRAGHMGLRALGDLAYDVGGRLTVRSAPGRGTSVTIEVPIG